jgi:hypothetical protein
LPLHVTVFYYPTAIGKIDVLYLLIVEQNRLGGDVLRPVPSLLIFAEPVNKSIIKKTV